MVAPYTNTYVMVLARTVDILFCGWIWRDYDVTISSMTGLELRRPQPALWAKILGGFLNWLQPGHCEGAIAADTYRALQALILLGEPCAVYIPTQTPGSGSGTPPAS